MTQTIQIHDADSPVLEELSETMQRVLAKLPSPIPADFLDCFERIINTFETPNDLLQVVTSDGDLSATVARDYIAEVQVTQRCRDFLAALRTFDRNLEFICESHGFASSRAVEELLQPAQPRGQRA